MVTQTKDQGHGNRNRNRCKYSNIFPFALLAAVARGEVDLNHWAGVVLAGRGLDKNACWMGFPDAARLLDQRSKA